MLNTIFAILTASSSMVLQLDEVKVNNIDWGVYYDSETLSCAVGSNQGDYTVFMQRDLGDKFDKLVLGSKNWNFTYDTNKLFSTTIEFDDKTTEKVTWDYKLQANTSYMTVTVNPNLFNSTTEKLTLQLNAKHKITYDIYGLGKMKAAYFDCIKQMEEIHAEILADTEEEN